MTVSASLVVVMAVLYGAGVYAMMERSLTRVLIGFLLLGNATNLLLLIAMGFPGVSPFYGATEQQSDPLPQALMLTAIVITFAVSAFLLALIYRSWQLGQEDAVEDDAEDIALRERATETTSVLDVEEGAAEEEDEEHTDFTDDAVSPITAVAPVSQPPRKDQDGGDRP